MKLSIIIPCYNSGTSVIKLLGNIFSQVVNRSDIEVIVVDDGSSDNTAEVINDFSYKNNGWCNFHLYRTENQGAAKARTFGLSKACGKYVFFCDSDDNIAEFFVEIISCEIEKKADIIYFNSIMSDCNTIPPIERRKVFFDENKIYENKNKFLFHLLKNGYYTSAVWTYVFKRDLVFSSGASFTNRKAHEDHLFTIKLLCYAKRIVVVNKLLYVQNIRKGSLTNSKKDVSYISDRYYAYREAKEFMQECFNADCVKAYTEWSLISLLTLFRYNIKLAVPVFLKLSKCTGIEGDVFKMLCICIRKIYGLL